MKIIPNTLFLLSIIVFTFSCRQIPENDETENISFGEPISVKIDLKGVEWMSNINDSSLISKNNS